MSFIINILDPQTFVGNQEAFFHHERRQSPDVMFVAELFTFCREVFFGCLFCLFLQELPTFCFTLRIIRGRERNIETSFLETIFLSPLTSLLMGVFNHATNRMIKKSDTLILLYLHKIVKFNSALMCIFYSVQKMIKMF